MRDLKYYDLKYYILLFVLVTLVGCSPTDSENLTKHVTISNLVGLWNSSEKNGAKTDIVYTRISSTGDIIEYDFDGDEIDQGLNCYHVNSGKIIHIKNSFFTVTTDMHKGQVFDVELELLDAGYALKINFLNKKVSDVLSVNDVSKNEVQDNIKIDSSQIWTRMRNNSVLDNEPSCSS